MAVRKINESTLTAIGNAIRSKTGGSSLINPEDMADEIESIETGGSGYTNDDFLDVTKPVGAVYSDATTISVGLTNRTGITSISLPNATTVPSSFASGCTGLKSFSAPNLTGGVYYICENCSSLDTNIFLPFATAMASCLKNCRFPIVVIGSVNSSQSSVFSDNPNLKKVDIIGGNSIGGAKAFVNDTSFDTLILRSTSLVSRGNNNNFQNTPFNSGKSGGTIYVPQTLISDYEADSNWAAVLGANPNNQILKIEGSQYENYYADGTAIPT